MSLDQFLTHFENVRRNGSSGYTVDCPCHASQSGRSLHIKEDGDKLLLHCFGGCKTEDILKAKGLSFSDLNVNGYRLNPTKLAPKSGLGVKPLEWLAGYCNVPLDFLGTLPIGEDGGNVCYSFDGLSVVKRRGAGTRNMGWEPKDSLNPPLWPMPEATLPENIWLTEGETDCIIARYLGLHAYAVTKGASTPLTLEQAQALKHRGVRRIVIVFDADKPGREGTTRLAEVVIQRQFEVANIDLAEAGLVDPLLDQKDLRDAWLTIRTPETLLARLQQAADLSAHYRDMPFADQIREVDASELAGMGEAATLESYPVLGKGEYIIRGWGHILSGYPKAGKSELLFACVRDWLADGVTVLWLSEEGRNVWQQRLSRYPNIPQGLRIRFALGADPEDLLQRARTGAADVLVVDTIRNLLQIRDETDNAEISRVLGSWEAALQGVTRVYVHHDRKMAGEHGQAIAGGGAFLGVVDRAIELKFDPHDKKRRQLVVHSRIAEAPDLLYELGADGLKALGDPDAVAIGDVADLILETLNGEWRKTKEVHDLFGDPKPSLRQTQQALRLLLEGGKVERDPAEDKPRATYRWRVSGSDLRTDYSYSAQNSF